jgi:hypothetical protein
MAKAGALPRDEVDRARGERAPARHQRRDRCTGDGELGFSLGEGGGEGVHGVVGDPRRLADVDDLRRRLHELEVMDKVRRLGDQRDAEKGLQREVVAGVKVISRNLEPHPRPGQAERAGGSREGRDRVVKLPPTPDLDPVDESVIGELRRLALPRQHRERPRLGGEEQTLELLIALRIRAGEPVDRDRVD